MKKIDELLAEIERKKREFESLGGLSQAVQSNLDDWYKVELTYTSNAIEGNTLSRAETALIVEKGITVAGKSIVEHLEANNHALAWEWVRGKASKKGYKFCEDDLLELHRVILQKIDEVGSGRYRSVPVRIAGSRVVMPNPMKVPELMEKYFEWINIKSENLVMRACESHYRLVSIHPFVDGNGRTARLVMNLLLHLAGYPPIIVRKEDRHEYLTSLETAQLGGSDEAYYRLMLTRMSDSLDIYLEATGRDMVETDQQKLLKMGVLASLVGESVPTIRHWTRSGLIPVAGYTKGGYQLYHPSVAKIVTRIRELQKERRLSLEEIRQELN